MTPVTEQVLFSTARIESCDANGQISVGTGFFYQFCKKENKHIPCIVTNKHVIEGSVKIAVTYRMKKSDLDESDGELHTLEIGNPHALSKPHPQDEIDLVAIPIGQIVETGLKNGYLPSYIPIDSTMLATEDELKKYMIADPVLMVGYPSGIWDHVNNFPLVRTGIISSLPKHDYQGRPEFVVDMACLPGSSGSPVFLYNTMFHRHVGEDVKVTPKCKLIGILYAGPAFELYMKIQGKDIPIDAPILDLGYVIKATQLNKIEEMLSIELERQGGYR